MKADAVIGALIGLVGAIEGGMKTESTDRAILRSLAFTAMHRDFSEEEINTVVSEIHAEKFAVSPNCATCASPCGKTSDHDMSGIYAASDDVRCAKLRLISELQRLGSKTEELPPEDMETVYRALAYISYDTAKEHVDEIAAEVCSITERVGENENDKENY